MDLKEKFKNRIVNLSRNKKTALTLLSDLVFLNLNFILIPFVFYFFYSLNLESFQNQFSNYSLLLNFTFLEILILSLASILIMFILDGYKSFFRSVGPESILGAPRVFMLAIYSILTFVLMNNKGLGVLNSFQVSWMQLLYVLFYSFIFRSIIYSYLANKSDSLTIPLIIYGAGQAGRETAAALLQSKKYKILGFIDDNKNLKNYKVLDIKILGNLNKIEEVKKNNPNLLVVIAINNLQSLARQKIISSLEQFEVQVKTIPSSYEGLSTKLSLDNLSLEDLIGREDSGIDISIQSKNILNKNILITGAGGSIGSELARQVANLRPKRLIMVDSSEYNLYKLSENFKNFKNFKSMIFVLRNIQSRNEMELIIKKEEINTIFHAAAYKHVPLLQSSINFKSAIENNFFSTYNLCEIAYKYKVQNFTLISTDKAVNPTNIMGASKRLAELSLQGFQDLKDNETCFSMVRFGNVFNSSGSVVPLFWEQISMGGPVTVTHENVTRFFMTIKEAAALVIQANSMASGGEVFLLDMGDTIQIKELAEKMIRLSGNSIASINKDNGIKILYSGLRPGEKLYEELLLSNNPLETFHPKIKKGIEKKYKLEEVASLKNDLNQSLNNSDYNLSIKLITNFVDGFKID